MQNPNRKVWYTQCENLGLLLYHLFHCFTCDFRQRFSNWQAWLLPLLLLDGTFYGPRQQNRKKAANTTAMPSNIK